MEEIVAAHNKDTLTGVYNRYFLKEFIDFELQRKKRYGGHLSLLICDLDNFKNVNDAYGHLKGDEILVYFAKLLQQSIRSSDIVARYGGDEFILVLTDTPKEMAHYVAERIISGVADSAVMHELGVGVSIGISGYPEDGKSLKELLRKADQALYDAKRSGKGRFSFYSGDINLKPVIPAKDFIGRKEVLNKLRELYTSKHSKIILIEGPVGVGKTRLVEESLKTLSNVIKAYASVFGMNIPYFEIKESLKQLYKSDRTRFQSTLSEIEDFARNAVYSILPYVAPKETPAVENEYSLFEGLRLFYSKYFKGEPFVLFLDDIQWASPESLRLLLYITEREPLFKGVFIKRIEENSEALSNFLDVLNKLSHLNRLEVPPLSEDDTKDLLKIILGTKYPSKLLRYIVKHTGGNPFFMEETLRELFEQGYLKVIDGEWQFNEPDKVLVSGSLEDVVLRKIRELSKAAIRLMEIIALWDAPIDVRTLSILSGMDEGEILFNLDKMEYLKLVSTKESLYYLSAGAIRNIIIKGMTSAKKMAIHRRLASTLEHILPENNEYIEKIAYHYFEGGEKKKALKYLKLAYERAEKVKSLKLARDFLEKILSIEEDPQNLLRLVELKMETESNEKARLTLEKYMEKYGRTPGALQLLSEIEERKGNIKGAIEILDSINTKDNQLYYRLQSDKAWLLMVMGRYTEAQNLLDKVLLHLKDRDPQEYHSILHYLATLYYSKGQYEKAIDIARKVIEFYEKQEKVPFGALNTLALSLRSIGKYDESLKAFRKAIENAKKRGIPHSLATLLGNIALVYWDKYEYNKARECFEEAISIFTSMGVFDSAAFHMNNMLEMLIESGMIETGKIPLSYVRRVLNRIHAFTSTSTENETRVLTYINEIEYANLTDNYKEALYWSGELLHLLKNMEDGAIKNYGAISAAYSFTNNCLLKEALTILRHTYRTARKMDTLEWHIYIYTGIYNIMKKAGKDKKAGYYFNILKDMEDKLPEDQKIVFLERVFKVLAENEEKEKARKYYQKLIEKLQNIGADDKLKSIIMSAEKYGL